MTEQDPRLECGAYISDGNDLYEVIGFRVGPGALGVRSVWVAVEDCRDLQELEFVLERVRASFTLVRRAPAARCPDLVDQIVWEAPATARATRAPLQLGQRDVRARPRAA